MKLSIKGNLMLYISCNVDCCNGGVSNLILYLKKVDSTVQQLIIRPQPLHHNRKGHGYISYFELTF
jgi:hypothetical protein